MKDKEQGKSSPASRGKRFLKLAQMTASVAGTQAKSRVKSAFQSKDAAAQSRAQSYEKTGEVVARTLGELKGAVMKVGQMASIAGDILPEEVTRHLQVLQRQAPPMSFDVIADQIESELGARPELLFNDFEEVPFAAASIGQVHRAVTDDGREVVVKVQYPGVDASCDSDLSQVKLALKMSGFVQRAHKKAFDLLFEEMRTRLHEELDYCLEADNVRLFQKLHANDPFVIVPEVVGERSAQRVLTLTYVPGDGLQDVQEHYPQEIRDQIGENVYRVFGRQLFEYCTLHADPNPANFAYREDGRVVLYDFGCVKKLPVVLVKHYSALVRAILDENYADVEKGLVAIGARCLDGPAVPEDFYRKWRNYFIEPFLRSQYYDYSQPMLQAIIKEQWASLLHDQVRYSASFQPPADGIMIDRVVLGLYGNLRQIAPRVKWRELVEEHIALSDNLEIR